MRNPLLILLCAAAITGCTSPQLPALGEVAVSPKDGMRLLYVPAGPFAMGTDSGWDSAKPAHEVNLDPFWIDETEVTNRMYSLCVEEAACAPPAELSSYTRDHYFSDPSTADFPVLHVAWEDAQKYCLWAERSLPTEAQWEKAARGADGRLYPWGNNAPSADLLNSFAVTFLEDTVQVGSYPRGASPYGALDMAGNVWEWTADYISPYPGGDPSALDYDQGYRVLRGGSFVDPADATTRYGNSAELRMHDIGFRCALQAQLPSE